MLEPGLVVEAAHKWLEVSPTRAVPLLTDALDSVYVPVASWELKSMRMAMVSPPLLESARVNTLLVTPLVVPDSPKEEQVMVLVRPPLS